MFEALQSFQPQLRAHSVFTQHYFSSTAVDCSNKDGHSTTAGGGKTP